MREAGRRWRCSEPSCSQRGTTSLTCAWPRRWTTAPAFAGFAAHEPTPERTAFVRLRAELVRRGLDRTLFEAITRQLDSHGVVVRTGTLVDATLIPSASVRQDSEAR